MPSVDSAESMKILYHETAEEWRFFLDYRHKFLERYVVAVGAVILIIGWTLDHYQTLNESAWWIALAVSILSYIAFLIDKRNAAILLVCQHRGRDLERRLVGDSGPDASNNSKHDEGADGTPNSPSHDSGLDQVNLREFFAPVTRNARQALWDDLDAHARHARSPGFFNALSVSFKTTVTHTGLFSMIFWLVAVLSAIATVGLIVRAILLAPGRAV